MEQFRGEPPQTPRTNDATEFQRNESENETVQFGFEHISNRRRVSHFRATVQTTSFERVPERTNGRIKSQKRVR